jgi:hypothetical protein
MSGCAAHGPSAMTNTFRAVLRAERGSALIDSLVGVIVTAIVVSSVASLAVGITSSMKTTNADAIRSSALQSYVNDQSSQPDAVALTGTTTAQAIGGSTVPVTVWRTVPTSGTAVIHAATNRDQNATADNCADPAAVTRALCLTSSVTVTLLDAPAPVGLPVAGAWTVAGVDGASPVSAPVGVVGTFDGTGKTAVRYVVKLTSATAPGTLTFENGAAILATVPFDSLTYGAAPGYVYGSVTIGTATTITVRVTGAAVSLSRLYLYEVPR